MAVRAGIDVGCGVYTYQLAGPKKVVPPRPKPKSPEQPKKAEIGKVKCYGESQFGSHSDVQPGSQNRLIGWACVGSAKKSLKAGDSPITFETKEGSTPYHYSITWLNNCKSTVNEMNVYQPVPKDKDNTCMSMLRKVYTDCKYHLNIPSWLPGPFKPSLASNPC